jgi:hypothetical protein
MIAPFSIGFLRIQAYAQSINAIKSVQPVIVTTDRAVIIADDGAPDNAQGDPCAKGQEHAASPASKELKAA